MVAITIFLVGYEAIMDVKARLDLALVHLLMDYQRRHGVLSDAQHPLGVFLNGQRVWIWKSIREIGAQEGDILEKGIYRRMY